MDFTESSDVTEFLGGGSDEAGFVQVMKVSGVDRAKVERLDASFDKFANLRPDLLGGLRVWTGPDAYVEAAYFTSEAEARAGEKAEVPEELQPTDGRVPGDHGEHGVHRSEGPAAPLSSLGTSAGTPTARFHSHPNP